MRERLFECLLARDALSDYAIHLLHSVNDPDTLARIVESMFGTGMELINVEMTNIRADVFVMSWEDNWKFCFVLDG